MKWKDFQRRRPSPDPQIRRDHHDDDNVERERPDRVLQRLAWRVHRVEEIDDPKFCRLVKQKNDGMKTGEGEGGCDNREQYERTTKHESSFREGFGMRGERQVF